MQVRASIGGESSEVGEVSAGELQRAEEREEEANCSRRGREGRRCCWRGGRGGPGTTGARPGWPTLGADPGRVQACLVPHAPRSHLTWG